MIPSKSHIADQIPSKSNVAVRNASGWNALIRYKIYEASHYVTQRLLEVGYLAIKTYFELIMNSIVWNFKTKQRNKDTRTGRQKKEDKISKI